MNASTASGVEGILAPSTTAITPFFKSVFAASPSSSFCVAHGNAISHFIVQIPLQPSV